MNPPRNRASRLPRDSANSHRPRRRNLQLRHNLDHSWRGLPSLLTNPSGSLILYNMKTHYVMPGRQVAICGANQGRKIFSRIPVTSDKTQVTCALCAKRMDHAADFAAELMTRLGLAK
jgi:hypothetical protein